MGRPALDATKKREVIAILAMGGHRTTAASYVGCSPRTITNTAKRDPEFGNEVLRATSQYEILHLSNINAAAKESRHWRAAAWALERTYPDRYGQRKPHVITREQVTGVLKEFANIVLSEVEDSKIRQRIRRRVARLVGSLAKKKSQRKGNAK